jgi:hypothetical protein
MHPKIFQFWIDAGYNPYKSGEYYDAYDGVYNYWTLSPAIIDTIAIIYQNPNISNIYFFAGNKYNEKEILKVIKLKVFI